jgi:hypothetical protein
MVGHIPLEDGIGVRVPDPQPNFKRKICVEISRFRRRFLLMKDLKETVEFLTKLIPVTIGASFASGFLIWNIYLQALGFSPDDLFQGRFILTGVLFLHLSLALFFVGEIIKYLITILFKSLNLGNKILFHGIGSQIHGFCLGVIAVLWVLVFSIFIFPQFSPAIGGARPRFISLISSSEEISVLNTFGIQNPPGASFQTALVCYVYEG